MHSHYEKKIGSDAAYFHALFGLLIAWTFTIRCTRSYFYPGLIPKGMQKNCKKTISSDCAYLNALFWLMIALSSAIWCTRSYFLPVLIIRKCTAIMKRK